MLSLHKPFDSIFDDDLFRLANNVLLEPKVHHRTRERYRTSYILEEKEEALFLSLDLPGVKKEDVEILVEEGFLKIRATREGYPDKTLQHRLAKEVLLDQSEATLENGVLSLKLPIKSPEKKIIPIS